MNYWCYANGKILKKNKIRVGITDLVMLRGYGVFDFLRTYYGMPFRLSDYLIRFENSAKGMNLKLPISKKEIIKTIFLLLKKNQLSTGNHPKRDFGIRLLLTGGYSLDSYLPSVKSNLFILVEDLPKYPAWWSEKGIKLITYDHSRELASIKTINYLTAIRLADERRRQKAQDTLYISDGKILETTRNNFFLFHGDILVTPNDFILHGITRKTVLEIAGKLFKIEVRDVFRDELFECTEAFITGTTRGITPVIQINDIKIGNQKPGKNTQQLIALFEETVVKECNSDYSVSKKRKLR